jgi:hypothetical protein
MFFKDKYRHDRTRYKHKCLKFFDYDVRDSSAEKICQSFGGTLISIHSVEENKFAMNNNKLLKAVGFNSR